MPERSEGSPEASQRVSEDDPQTVGQAAPADVDLTHSAAAPPPDPRGASKRPKTAKNQRSSSQSCSDCHTTLSYNCAADHRVTVSDRSKNRLNDCHTIVRDNRARGLWLRGSTYYYLKRVPLDLVPVVGKKQISRSLGTGSRQQARRLATVAAYDLHRYFESLREGRSGDDHGKPPIYVRHSPWRESTALLTLREAYDAYLSDPSLKRSGKSLLVYRTVGDLIMDVLGPETPLVSISRADCRELLDLLARMPCNARKRWPKKGVREAVALGESQNLRSISIANANGHMNKFCALLNWAVREDLLTRNPALGLRLPDPIGHRDKRRPFSIQQLRTIFESSVYTGREDESAGCATAGLSLHRNARFWVPLIALFTGMRLNEICQMDVADVRNLEGILCFVVSRTSLTGHSDKRVKTVSSERLVPVHPALVEFGFLNYLAARRSAEDRKLFPELQQRHGLYSHEFSRWFSRFIRTVGAAADRTCFHSFRHNFRDACREARIDRDIALALGGWTSATGTGAAVADHYGSGFQPCLLHDAVRKVRYPDLNLSHLRVDLRLLPDRSRSKVSGPASTLRGTPLRP